MARPEDVAAAFLPCGFRRGEDEDGITAVTEGGGAAYAVVQKAIRGRAPSAVLAALLRSAGPPLFSSGADGEGRLRDAMFLALDVRDDDAFRTLLQGAPPPDRCSSALEAVLLAACDGGLVAPVRCLLQEHRLEPRLIVRRYAALIAVSRDDPDTLWALIDAGMLPGPSIRAPHHLLVLAVMHDGRRVAEALLRSGLVEPPCHNALVMAALKGRDRMVGVLLRLVRHYPTPVLDGAIRVAWYRGRPLTLLRLLLRRLRPW